MNKENIHTIARNILTSYYPEIKSDTISTSHYPNIININQLGRQYILKIHNPLIAANLKQLDKIYSICSEKKLIPKIIQSKTGNYIQKHGTILVSLQNRIPHDDSEIDPTVLGQRVATLHSVLDSLQIKEMKNHLERVVYDILNLSIQYGYGKLSPIVEKVIELTKKNSKQIIHGDLHKKNIINHQQRIYFIDLDSANFFLPVSEIAFSAFRFFCFKIDRARKYIDFYNQFSKGKKIQYEYLWQFAVYNVLQRILYIRIENDKGNEKCMWDLPNQEQYLQELLSNPRFFSTS